jgi:hypothetical protein
LDEVCQLNSSIVNLALLYNDLRAVIPSVLKSKNPDQKTGFRIRSGMTKYVMGFLKHYTNTNAINNLSLLVGCVPRTHRLTA